MFERWIRRGLPSASPFARLPYVILVAMVASAGLAIAVCLLGDAILDHQLAVAGHRPVHFLSAMFAPACIGTTVRITAAVRHATEAKARRAIFVSGWWLTAMLFGGLSYGFMVDGPGLSVPGSYTVFASCFLASTVATRLAAYGLVRVLLGAARLRSLDEWSRAARLLTGLLLLSIGVLAAAGASARPVLFVGGLFLCVAIPNELFLALVRGRLRAISSGTDPSFATRPLRDDESPAPSRVAASESRLGIVPRHLEAYREAGDDALARI